MATQNIEGHRGFIAEADLSAKQYFILKLGATANGVALAAGATESILGILQNKPTANQIANVRLCNSQGTSKVKAGGTINAGDWVTSDANGKAVATTTAGNIVIGRALEAAVDGDIIEIENAFFRY
jgi:hypothetical protein